MSHFDEKAARENSSGNPTFITGARWQHSQDAAKIAELGNQLEIERMRLAGCSVAALGYFDGCNDEYNSASLQDVLALRTKADQQAAKIAELEAEVERLRCHAKTIRESAANTALNTRFPDGTGVTTVVDTKTKKTLNIFDTLRERDQLAEKLRVACEALEFVASDYPKSYIHDTDQEKARQALKKVEGMK